MCSTVLGHFIQSRFIHFGSNHTISFISEGWKEGRMDGDRMEGLEDRNGGKDGRKEERMKGKKDERKKGKKDERKEGRKGKKKG